MFSFLLQTRCQRLECSSDDGCNHLVTNAFNSDDPFMYVRSYTGVFGSHGRAIRGPNEAYGPKRIDDFGNKTRFYRVGLPAFVLAQTMQKDDARYTL